MSVVASSRPIFQMSKIIIHDVLCNGAGRAFKAAPNFCLFLLHFRQILGCQLFFSLLLSLKASFFFLRYGLFKPGLDAAFLPCRMQLRQ